MAKKRVANKKEKEHLAKVASLGCYVCERPANVHHIRPKGLGIGRRSSHFDTIPLCYDHHQGQFSIHNCKKEFEDINHYMKNRFEEEKKLIMSGENSEVEKRYQRYLDYG